MKQEIEPSRWLVSFGSPVQHEFGKGFYQKGTRVDVFTVSPFFWRFWDPFSVAMPGGPFNGSTFSIHSEEVLALADPNETSHLLQETLEDLDLNLA